MGLLEDILSARDAGELPLHLAVRIDAPDVLATAWKTEALEDVLEVAWLIGEQRQIFDLVLRLVRWMHAATLGDEAVYAAEVAKAARPLKGAKFTVEETLAMGDPMYARELTDRMIELLSQYLGGQLRQVEMEAMVGEEYNDQYQYFEKRGGRTAPYGNLIAAVSYEAIFATQSRDAAWRLIHRLGPTGRAYARGLRDLLPTPTSAQIFALFDMGPR